MTTTTATTQTAPAVLDAKQIDDTARKFAAKWDTSATQVFETAKHARTLKESGTPLAEILDIVKCAIAERQAEALNITDIATIANIAGSVKISVPAISQLATALTRTETACINAAANKTVVKAFYDAAVGGVKSGDLNQIAKDSADLNEGRAAFVVGRIATERDAVGAARRAKAADKKAAAAESAASADNNDESVEPSAKSASGAAMYTLADILRAADRLASKTGNKAIRAVANMIVEDMAS